MRETVAVSVKDLHLLLEAVQAAEHHPQVGFYDINRTAGQLKAELNMRLSIDKELIESALWCANMLIESGEWQMDIALLASRIAPHHKFDRLFHTLEKR